MRNIKIYIGVKESIFKNILNWFASKNRITKKKKSSKKQKSLFSGGEYSENQDYHDNVSYILKLWMESPQQRVRLID